MAPRLRAVRFDDLVGFESDDCLAAFAAFARSARALCQGAAPTRPARDPSPRLVAIAREALGAEIRGAADARALLRRALSSLSRRSRGGGRQGVPHRLLRTARQGFADAHGRVRGADPRAPPRSRRLSPRRRAGRIRSRVERRAAPGRRDGCGPIPTARRSRRRAAKRCSGSPIRSRSFSRRSRGRRAWNCPTGARFASPMTAATASPIRRSAACSSRRARYAEREMSLARLKSWLREHGLEPGERGRALMQRNRSYVFFKIEEEFDPSQGPIGGAGIPLTPLRSIAVDRSIWAYGTPFWIDAELPWDGEAASPVSPPDDRAGHGIGDPRRGARRHLLRRRRGGGRARRRHSPSRRVHGAVASRRRAMKEATDKPRASRLRRLSDEEIALWVEVAKSVAKRRGASLPTLRLARTRPRRQRRRRRPPSPRRPSPRKPSGPPPLAPLERRLKRDLARGRGAVDSAIDLHGMNQAEAHHALRGFLVHAQSQGDRLVIVVTGKGGARPRPGRRVLDRRARRPAAARPALAARSGPARGGARLRGGGPRPRRRRRALRPAAPPRPAVTGARDAFAISRELKELTSLRGDARRARGK